MAKFDAYSSEYSILMQATMRGINEQFAEYVNITCESMIHIYSIVPDDKQDRIVHMMNLIYVLRVY